jgi:hypothetical protein
MHSQTKRASDVADCILGTPAPLLQGDSKPKFAKKKIEFKS